MDHSSDLHTLVRSDPERAWPQIVQLIKDGADHAAALDLLEDLVYDHDEAFIVRIESEAEGDPAFRHTVIEAHVGGFATAGVEAFRRLQERLRTS